MALNPTEHAENNVVPNLLLAEALGFVPQLLLDDIINVANSAVIDAVDGMEDWLEKWVEDHAQPDGTSHNRHEVEQGLVAFQTLLEYQTDLAFDFFEAWSLRNIFKIPPDLPIVLPHQEHLDLHTSPEREAELMTEVETLRKEFEKERLKQRVLKKAIRASETRRIRAEKRLEHLSIMDTDTLNTLATLPDKLIGMYQSISSMPPTDSTAISALTQLQAEPAKRQWETSKTGYLSWAVNQLLARSRVQSGTSSVDEIGRSVAGIAQVDQLRKVYEAIEGVRADLVDVQSLTDRSMDDVDES